MPYAMHCAPITFQRHTTRRKFGVCILYELVGGGGRRNIVSLIQLNSVWAFYEKYAYDLEIISYYYYYNRLPAAAKIDLYITYVLYFNRLLSLYKLIIFIIYYELILRWNYFWCVCYISIIIKEKKPFGL